MSKKNNNVFFEQCRRLKEKYGLLYLYGTGLYARNMFHVLAGAEIDIDGFVVTKKDDDSLFEKKVFEFWEIKHEKPAIILGLNKHNTNTVMNYLNEQNFDLERVISSYEFYNSGTERAGYDDPMLEITTVIGCRISCKFCPQKELVHRYFMEKTREKYLSAEKYRMILSKIPKNVTISFAGMSEPFLNNEFMHMLDDTCKSGHKINLYTTLVGASKDDIKTLIKLPINYVVLHVADKYQFANIPSSEEYYQMIDTVVHARKVNNEPFVGLINSQAEPEERIQEIVGNEYHIYTELFDRAGNLEGINLISRKNIVGKIECSMCGENLNRNVLLPDGTVLLCCMDYGMKHILGNLFEKTYEEIMNGSELLEIKQKLNSEYGDVLCRNCSCANMVYMHKSDNDV